MTEFTNPNDYQKQAARTECSQGAALGRIIDLPLHNRLQTMRLLHGIIGLMGELGELAGAVERWIWYGQDFDGENFVEELGDSQWYMAELHNSMGVAMLETMRANIRKLRSRYPEKFDQELAKEENRNREEEMKAAIGEIETGPITSRFIVCPNCDSSNVTCPSNSTDYVCLSCGQRFGLYKSSKPSVEQTGQGFAEPIADEDEPFPIQDLLDQVKEPDKLITKEEIDKALEGQDSFAMKDFKGFQNKVDPPYLYGKSRDVRPGEEKQPEDKLVIGDIRERMGKREFWTGKTWENLPKEEYEKMVDHLRPPEDGWTVARKIVNTFVEGSQNVSYAWKMIDQAEEQWKKELPRSTPPKDLGEQQRLTLTGKLAIAALGLDPDNTSPQDVADEIYGLKSNAS